MTRPVVFSASSVNAYLDCHLQWWFTYVLNEEGEQSEQQATGIAMHDAAEMLLRHTRPPDAFDDFPDIAPLVGVFVRDILPTYENPVLIEAPFQIEVNDVPFSGVIDAVDEHDMTHIQMGIVRLLRDLKTTGSRPRAGRYRFNMTGYWLGARDLGYEPHLLMLDYIVRTKTPYYWPEPMEAIEDSDIETFASTLIHVNRQVEAGDFRASGVGTRACASCPYTAICAPYQQYMEATTSD